LEIENNFPIESKHPYLRNFKISQKDQTIEVAPYKSPKEDVTTNTKHITQ
jgi:hypothetical protein